MSPELQNISSQQQADAAVPNRLGGRTPGNLPGGISPQELVEKVADKVYALLLQELKYEAERYRSPAKGGTRFPGGR